MAKPIESSPLTSSKFRPQYNLKTEILGWLVFVVLGLSGFLGSGYVILFKNHPLQTFAKPVTLIAKTSGVSNDQGGYGNHLFTLRDSSGRVFNHKVYYQEFIKHRNGDTFDVAYREYDVNPRWRDFWLYGIAPMVIGGLSLWMLLIVTWDVINNFLKVKNFI